MNALDLADRLEEFYSGTHITKAAEQLRKLYLENEEFKTKYEMPEITQADIDYWNQKRKELENE